MQHSTRQNTSFVLSEDAEQKCKVGLPIPGEVVVPLRCSMPRGISFLLLQLGAYHCYTSRFSITMREGKDRILALAKKKYFAAAEEASPILGLSTG